MPAMIDPPHSSPMSKHSRRNGLIEWIESDASHALHLAPNRHDMSFSSLKGLFGRLCLEADRYMLGVKHVHLRSSHDRLRMVAFPEKLDTNPHLHAFANFSEAQWGDRIHLPWEDHLQRVWRNITDGSGTIVIQHNIDRGAAIYATKEAFRRDHKYLHSWFFHRNDKLQKRPNAASLHGAAPKEAALNS